MFAPVWTLRLLVVGFIVTLVHLWGPWPWCLRERVLRLEAQERIMWRDQQVVNQWTRWLAQHEQALKLASEGPRSHEAKTEHQK